MKKAIALAAIISILLAGCSKANKTELPTDPSGASDISAVESTATDPSSGSSEQGGEALNIYASDRSYAVMIDNDGNSSRPHAGLEDAYLIYEMYVEGKATRLMALFKGVTTQKIGPVRSSRHYFLDYVFDNDALYSHAGFSPLAMEQISSMGVDALNGLTYEPTYYWRERKYKGDYHSLYTSVNNLSNLADKLGYRKTSDTLPFKFESHPAIYEGESAVDITIPYADFYYVSYKYDETSGLYDRYINSGYHATQSGAKLKAGQIIIQYAKSYPLGDGTARIQIDTTGSGKGIFISNGVQVPITWKKSSRKDPLKFYTSNGSELVLDDSKVTYVQVMPQNLDCKIK